MYYVTDRGDLCRPGGFVVLPRAAAETINDLIKENEMLREGREEQIQKTSFPEPVTPVKKRPKTEVEKLHEALALVIEIFDEEHRETWGNVLFETGSIKISAVSESFLSGPGAAEKINTLISMGWPIKFDKALVSLSKSHAFD